MSGDTKYTEKIRELADELEEAERYGGDDYVLEVLAAIEGAASGGQDEIRAMD